MSKISALFWIMRPVNSITASIAVFVSAFLALPVGEKPFDPLTYLFIGTAAFFTTAQANTHNDIIDIEVDKINSPNRALPSGVLSIKEAKLWAIFLFILAVLSGVIIDVRLNLTFPLSTFWAVFNSLLLDLYNWKLKKSGIFGNMIVSYVVYALFLYSDLLINHGLTWNVEGIGLFAFFLNWAREIIKGIRDIEGDRIGGIKTVGVLFGAKGAAIAASIFIILSIISSIIIVITTNMIILQIVLLSFDIILIYKSYYLLKDPNPDYTTNMKKLMLYLMTISLIFIAISKILEYL